MNKPYYDLYKDYKLLKIDFYIGSYNNNYTFIIF